MENTFSHLICLLFLMIVVFTIINFILTKPFKKKGIRLEELDAVSGYLICIAFVVIVFSFYAVNYILTDFKQSNSTLEKWYENASNFASVLSGITLPFIGIGTAIVAGLAFYMQYQANQQLRNQFKLQQFESQFYEMLKLHKENVNEMELLVYKEVKDDKIDFGKSDLVKGRKVFTHLQGEFHLILSKISTSNHKRFEDGFYEAYDLFFNGIPQYVNLED